jgi:hypothetical protein
MMQEITMHILTRLRRFFTVAIIICGILVWYFFEERSGDTAQAFYFIIGASS